MKKFYLTNTLSGRREEFKPANPPVVKFYSCGPTVYGPLHIGNARAMVVADLIYRWLLHIGYDVKFVRNYTDVDDKIIAQANIEKIESNEIAQKYIDYCETDMKALGVRAPTKVCRVTESMDDIRSIIQKIIDRGHAYVVDGEVLFSIESFKSYGKLSGRKVDELQAGARVEVDTKKRNPMDFSLWKPHKPGEPFWESSWGAGRPGWHIECSAMVERWLGAETIDLHHGGQDLMFPHHENEIAQSEAAHGNEFCRHWVHHAFLTSGNEKMSKSLGNILTIREFNTKYSPELLKYLYLSFHFRTGVPYTEETMDKALTELERLYTAKRWAESVVEKGQGGADVRSIEKFSPLIGRSLTVFEQIENEMYSDLNTPGALGHLFTLIRELNRAEAEAAGRAGVDAPISVERFTVAHEFLELLNEKLYPLWNVLGEPTTKMLTRIDEVRREMRLAKQGAENAVVYSDEQIQKMIQERLDARKSKNFARADEIRKELDAAGIVLVDSPQGTTWKSK